MASSPGYQRICFSILLVFHQIIQNAIAEENSPIAFDEKESVRGLKVDCSPDGMSVTASFREPFSGIIYSNGHYSDDRCVYVKGDGQLEYRFKVPADGCGTARKEGASDGTGDRSFENTVVFQNDPFFLEMWDTVRLLRCLWKQNYEKTIRSKPFHVYEEHTVPISLDNSAINQMTTIQQGKGPVQDRVSGYIHVGSETSLVVHLRGQMDANMMDCSVYDEGNSRKVVHLTDSQGCLMQNGMVTPFYKMRETSEAEGDKTMLYTYLEGYNLPQKFLITCNMKVCDWKCPRSCTIPVLKPSLAASENSVYSSATSKKSISPAGDGDIVWGKPGRFRRDVKVVAGNDEFASGEFVSVIVTVPRNVTRELPVIQGTGRDEAGPIDVTDSMEPTSSSRMVGIDQVDAVLMGIMSAILLVIAIILSCRLRNAQVASRCERKVDNEINDTRSVFVIR